MGINNMNTVNKLVITNNGAIKIVLKNPAMAPPR